MMTFLNLFDSELLISASFYPCHPMTAYGVESSERYERLEGCYAGEENRMAAMED